MTPKNVQIRTDRGLGVAFAPENHDSRKYCDDANKTRPAEKVGITSDCDDYNR